MGCPNGHGNQIKALHPDSHPDGQVHQTIFHHWDACLMVINHGFRDFIGTYGVPEEKPHAEEHITIITLECRNILMVNI